MWISMWKGFIRIKEIIKEKKSKETVCPIISIGRSSSSILLLNASRLSSSTSWLNFSMSQSKKRMRKKEGEKETRKKRKEEQKRKEKEKEKKRKEKKRGEERREREKEQNKRNGVPFLISLQIEKMKTILSWLSFFLINGGSLVATKKNMIILFQCLINLKNNNNSNRGCVWESSFCRFDIRIWCRLQQFYYLKKDLKKKKKKCSRK